jgi:hypothetical protein
MKTGEIQLSDDKQSLIYCGKTWLYTLKIGDTYQPTKERRNAVKNVAYSSVNILGFVPGTETTNWLVIVGYTDVRGVSGRRRQQRANTVQSLCQNFDVPRVVVPRVVPAPKLTPPTDYDLAAKLVAQLVADVAELRSRVSALENSKGGES